MPRNSNTTLSLTMTQEEKDSIQKTVDSIPNISRHELVKWAIQLGLKEILKKSVSDIHAGLHLFNRTPPKDRY